jgi:hypothetical protein
MKASVGCDILLNTIKLKGGDGMKDINWKTITIDDYIGGYDEQPKHVRYN